MRIAVCLALLASSSLIAVRNDSKDSIQQDHGIGGSLHRARNGGRGEKGNSMFVANIMSRNTRLTTELTALSLFELHHQHDVKQLTYGDRKTVVIPLLTALPYAI